LVFIQFWMTKAIIENIHGNESLYLYGIGRSSLE
jgi:hypothetical protein